MATVNIKQNNIDFTVDNANTSKSWIPSPGSTFAPADLGTDFNINMLKTVETEGWLNDLRILHGLFIDWDGAQITLNGTTYTINNTGELFSAIENANKTYSLGDYQGKLKSRAFYTKYNKLLSRINKLIDDKTSYIEPLYSVGIDVTNGRYTGGQSYMVEHGKQASWEVSAFDGYKLPTSVTNGTISGNIVTSDEATKDFTVYVVCEEDISNTEPAYAEYYFLINNIKVFENTRIDLDQTITIPTPPDGEIGDGETFEGWQCELNGNLYQPGETFTLTQEDYDKITEGTFAFSAVLKPKTYQVGINVTNGWYLGTSPETIEYDKQASWEVYANEGYKLPTSVTNGTISGNIVTSYIVTQNFTVDVVCEEDISNTEHGSSNPESSGTEHGSSNPESSGTEPGSSNPESSGTEPGSSNPESSGTEPGSSVHESSGTESGLTDPDSSGTEPDLTDPDSSGTEPDISYIEPDVSYIEPGLTDPE